MNPLLHSFQAAGVNWLQLAGPMLLQSSLLIGLLLLADLALHRYARAVFRHSLWLLVLVKLVLPTSLSLPLVSTGYWLPLSPVQPPAQTMVLRDWQVSFAPASSEALTGVTASPTTHPNPLGSAGMLFAAWLAGMVSLGGYVARQGWRARRLVRAAQPAPPELAQRLETCRQQVGLRRAVEVRLSATIGSPAVCGLVRPVVLLPAALPEQLAPKALDAVLLHELTHLRRGDGWWHWLQTVLQVLYWWHPLVWFANARIRRLREQAVDEQVMALLGRGGELYAETLVAVAKLASQRPAGALGMVGILESPSALKERVQRLLVLSPNTAGRLGFVNLLAIIATGCVLLPMAGSSTNDPATEPSSNPIVPPVTADAAAPAATHPLVLEISGQPARFTLNGQAVATEDLAARLRACQTNDPNAVLSLRADQEVPMQSVQQAIAAATDAGITRLSLRTVPAAGQGAPAIGVTPENAGQTPVPGAVATVTGVMDVEMMKRYGLIPAETNGSTGTSVEMAKRYGLLKPANQPAAQAAYLNYTVKPGDTLEGIAQAYTDSGVKVTSTEVLQANPKLDPAKLHVGQKLLIPQPGIGDANPAVATAAQMDPVMMKRYGLTPAATSGATGMSPAMARRYGLATPPQTESRIIYNMPEEMRRRYGLMPAASQTNDAAQTGEAVPAGAAADALRKNLEVRSSGVQNVVSLTAASASISETGAVATGAGMSSGMGWGGGGSSGSGSGQLNRVAASSAPIPRVAVGMGHRGASSADSGEDAVTVSAAFYAIPAAEATALLKELNAGDGVATEARPGRAWTLDAGQTRQLTAQLKETKSAQFLGRPRITTPPGQDALITDTLNASEPGSQPRQLVFRVAANPAADGTDLTIGAGSVSPGDLVSLSARDRVQIAQTKSPPAATGSTSVLAGQLALNPADALHQAKAHLAPGTCLVVIGEAAELPGDRQLLVLVQTQ